MLDVRCSMFASPPSGQDWHRIRIWLLRIEDLTGPEQHHHFRIANILDGVSVSGRNVQHLEIPCLKRDALLRRSWKLEVRSSELSVRGWVFAVPEGGFALAAPCSSLTIFRNRMMASPSTTKNFSVFVW